MSHLKVIGNLCRPPPRHYLLWKGQIVRFGPFLSSSDYCSIVSNLLKAPIYNELTEEKPTTVDKKHLLVLKRAGNDEWWHGSRRERRNKKSAVHLPKSGERGTIWDLASESKASKKFLSPSPPHLRLFLLRRESDAILAFPSHLQSLWLGSRQQHIWRYCAKVISRCAWQLSNLVKRAKVWARPWDKPRYFCSNIQDYSRISATPKHGP